MNHTRLRLSLTLFVFVLLIQSQALAEEKQSPSCVAAGTWSDADSNIVKQTTLLKTLAKQQVVLLGEDHENAQHHRWQLHTIAKLHAIQPDMMLAFESFPRNTQPILDSWVAGKLSEKQFLDQVNWQKIWTYNPDYYLPLFYFARMHRIPMIAMNVNRSLVAEVSQKGWKNIPPEQREGITDPAPAQTAYLEMLADIFSQHMPGGGHGHGTDPSANIDVAAMLNNPGFQRFSQGQLLWDRAMAEAIHKNHPRSKLTVAIVGAGHIMGGYGIPHQLNDLGIKKIKTLMPWDGVLECAQLKENIVDYVFGTDLISADQEALSKPKLGVYLEAAEQGVAIKKVIPDSIAEKTGIKAGDTIVDIAGRKANSIADVVNAVQATAWGTWLPLTIQRQQENKLFVVKFPAAAE